MDPIPDQDLLAALAYLDGELTEAEHEAFEARLLEDPDLAARVTDVAAMEGLTRLAAITGPGVTPSDRFRKSGPARPALLTLIMVAATLLVVVLLRGSSAPRAVAVLPRGDDRLHHQRLLGMAADTRPEGTGPRDGAEATPPWPRASYLAEVARKEESRRDAGLGRADESLVAGHFEVVLEVAEPSWVVIIGADGAGSPSRFWPGGEAIGLGVGRHVLPGDSFREDAAGLLAFDPGFLVPLGAGRMDVRVAIGARSLTERTDLERVLSAFEQAGLEATCRRLEEMGFELLAFEVAEPAH